MTKLNLGVTTALGALLLSVVWVGGCQPKASPNYRQDPVGESGVHAVHSERLVALMAEIQRLDDRLPQELEVEEERRQRTDEISEAARLMAQSARKIPDVLQEVQLTPTQRQSFLDLAKRLEVQASELEEHASSGSVSQLSQDLEQVEETCDFCHRRFRILPLIKEDNN